MRGRKGRHGKGDGCILGKGQEMEGETEGKLEKMEREREGSRDIQYLWEGRVILGWEEDRKEK